MKNLITILLIFFLTSCSKKEIPGVDGNISIPPTSTVTTIGTLSGMINPAGAAMEIILAADTNSKPALFRVVPDVTGHFNFNNLPPGVYNLSFATTSGFISPSPLRTQVTAGKDKLLDVINFEIVQTTGTIAGIVSPATAATMVFATNEGSSNTSSEIYTEVNKSTGTFEFSGVKPGKYTIRFVNVAGFAPPAIPQVNLIAGQRSSMGTISFRNTATGSLSGTVSHPNEVMEILASGNTSPAQQFTVKPDANGNFIIDQMNPGEYFVAALKISGSKYFEPFGRYVTVTEGQHSNAGNFVFSVNPPSYPIVVTLDGTSVRAATSARLTDNILRVNTFLGRLAFRLTINDFKGVGDYVCTAASGSNIFLGEWTSTVSLNRPTVYGYGRTWNANTDSGNGTIRITAYDPVNKTITGNFSADLSGSDNSFKKISGGELNQLQYR
ncbi:MAG: carboxypeptidase-like regulatory domain-containing protein [Bacteroidota bacterium]